MSIDNIITVVSVYLPVYIVGDFNIKIFNYNERNSQNLVNTFHSYFFFSIISKPTHVTNTSSSIIDHFWTNNFDNYITSGIIFYSINDHFSIFSSFKHTCFNNISDTVTLKKRKFTNEDITAFKEEFNNFNWNTNAYNFNVSYLFNRYINNFTINISQYQQSKLKKNTQINLI